MKKNKNHNPVLLVILDGLGIAPPSQANAVYLAKTPFFDSLFKDYPNTTLKASGSAVGLPPGQHGNSEAGHLNIGAGRVIEQDSVKITKAIKDRSFFKNPAFLEAVRHVRKNDSKMHIMGLISKTQSPHMNPEHLQALLELCQKEKLKKVFLHLFTDGRDSPQFSAIELIKRLRKSFKNGEKIVSLAGRYYLNRKKDWAVTEKVYNLLILGEDDLFKDPVEAIVHNYNRRFTDEFIKPTIIAKNEKERRESRISDNDAVIFYNLRSDRARQLTKPFVQDEFNKMNPGSFKRRKTPKNIRFVAMTNFGPDLPGVLTAYPESPLSSTLPMVLTHLRQLYIAEAEKYAHVTYFLNGGYDHPVGGENRIMFASPKVDNYKKTPKMNSLKVHNRILAELKNRSYDFICVNFCNPDMIGHTGNLKAAIETMECLDVCLKDLVNKAFKYNASLFITADHGNIEKLTDLKTGEIYTEHTSNPVPFIFVSKNKRRCTLKENGVLANIAPTILDFMKIKKPKEMTKESLCQF